MAKVGLLKPKYSVITPGTDSGGAETETYGARKVFAKAITASTSINAPQTKLYADDGVAESLTEFNNGQMSFVGDDLEDSVLADISGATVEQSTGQITMRDTDTAPYLRFGFLVRRFKNNKSQWRAVVFPKVQFSVPGDDYETKGETIAFKTTTVTAEIMRGIDHSWKLMSVWADTEAGAEAALDALVKPEASE